MNRRGFLALVPTAASVARAAPAVLSGRAKPLVSFGVMTDVQYADAEPQGERHYRASLPKLEAAAADLAALGLPFSLHLGDVIDHDFVSFGRVLPLFGKLGHPVRHLLGNHDFSVADAEKPKVAATLGMPGGYHAFSHGGARFVMLDTNGLSIYKHPAGSPEAEEAAAALAKLAASGANNAQAWNGGVDPAQLVWLEKELAAADAARQPAIVCGHHPLLAEDGHQAWNNREILAVIERHASVRAYLCGHHHPGGQVLHRGVPFLTFKSLLHRPEVTAYAVLHLSADLLAIDGRGREASREIALG